MQNVKTAGSKNLTHTNVNHWRLKAEQKRERFNNRKEASITVSGEAKSYSDSSTTDSNLIVQTGQANDIFKQKVGETIKNWEDKVQASCSRSGGLPSERYKYVKQLVKELQGCLSDSVEIST